MSMKAKYWVEGNEAATYCSEFVKYLACEDSLLSKDSITNKESSFQENLSRSNSRSHL
jgi:hypothetical protein